MFNWFSHKNESWKPIRSDLKIPEPYLTYASYIGLFQKHLLEIQSVRLLLNQKIEEITNLHYDFIAATPQLVNIINQHSSIIKLKETFREYLKSTFEAMVDEFYIRKREKIGKVHFAIGLSPEWYIASQLRILQILSLHLQNNLKKSKFLSASESIQKLLGFDTQIILKTYSESYSYEMNSNLCNAVDKTADGKNIQQAFKIREEVDKVIAKTEEVRKKLEQSDVSIRKLGGEFATVLQETDKNLKDIQTSKKLISDALYSIEEISFKYGELMKSWNQMKTEVEKIRNVISVIEDIAERTNLLSLNASIEAARAGKEGAGFAVVSSEINKLSTQTADSVKDITQLVKNIVKTVNNINAETDGIKNLIKERVKIGFEAVDSFEDMLKFIRASSDKVFQFKEKFEHAVEEVAASNKKMFEMLYSQEILRELTLENTRKMFEYVNEINELRKQNLEVLVNIPLKVMIRAIKTEHKLWKWWLFSFMFGIINLTEEQILDHTQCRLGKWYYSIENPKVIQLKSYKDLESPHARLHSLAKEIFWNIKNNKIEEAERGLTELENLSNQIVNLLDILEKEIENIIF